MIKTSFISSQKLKFYVFKFFRTKNGYFYTFITITEENKTKEIKNKNNINKERKKKNKIEKKLIK